MTPRPAPPNPEHIVEGLSRAVTGGIVTSWDLFADPVSGDMRIMVATADDLRHLYTEVEAQAFVDAVFAAERVWPKVSVA